MSMHFLHVLSSCLLSLCLFSAVQTFTQGICCLLKGLPKPSALNCPGLLLSPRPASLTIQFQVTTGIRDYTGAFCDCTSQWRHRPACDAVSHLGNSWPSSSLLPDRHVDLPLQRLLRVWPGVQEQQPVLGGRWLLRNWHVVPDVSPELCLGRVQSLLCKIP